MSHKAKAIKAQSESLASAKLSLCNAEGIFLWDRPRGPGWAGYRALLLVRCVPPWHSAPRAPGPVACAARA